MQRLVIDGRSKSTHENYLRQMAKMALHCGKTPLEMEPDEIDNYLYFIVNRDTDSQSSFKHGYNQLSTLDVSHNAALTLLRLNEMPSLNKVCVWEMPFPPEGVEVDTTGSPNVHFTTDCSK